VNVLELKERIAGGENIHTEFKESLPEASDLAKSIVCFANTDGGQIIIGISDDGEVLGLEGVDKAIQFVDNVAYNNCEPPIAVIQETITINDKTVLVINVPKGEQRPYRTNSGIYYIRSGNRCRQASREELLRLFQATESIYYDETILYRADYSALDIDYFTDFLRQYFFIESEKEGLDIKILLRNLKLYREPHPTVAGILFFGKKPQDFLPHAKVIAACIRGVDLATPPFDKKEISGKLPKILEDAVAFLRLYLREEHKIEGFSPETEHEIPEVVLREAVVNALAHRDYTVMGSVRIFIFNDRVEVRTPGRLPNTVTIESIKYGGAHVPRNPTIYNLFAKMGMVTGIGSGVFRMIRIIRQHLHKEILLEQTETEFVLTIPRKE